jgi:putative transcription factor
VTECEICGRNTDDLYEVNVEGAVMLVCEKCSRGKSVLHTFGREAKKPAGAAPAASARESEGEEEIVENYGEVIRAAREALGLPIRVLAEKINETESSLARIERQKAPPGDKARKKLEKELGIKLMAKGEAKKPVVLPRKDQPLSIWDVAKKKGKVKAGE